jgi:hypothetical protein
MDMLGVGVLAPGAQSHRACSLRLVSTGAMTLAELDEVARWCAHQHGHGQSHGVSSRAASGRQYMRGWWTGGHRFLDDNCTIATLTIIK